MIAVAMGGSWRAGVSCAVTVGLWEKKTSELGQWRRWGCGMTTVTHALQSEQHAAG